MNLLKFKTFLSAYFLLLLVLAVRPVSAQTQLPDKPTAWVNDYAGVLSSSEKQELNRALEQLENRSSNQIFIAIFNKMPEDTYLEDFTVRLFEKWRPGLKNKDNGVLIVIFIQDRKIRIEAGYGLEDVITDLYAKRIIDNLIAPHFRKGDYYGGLKAALAVMIPAVEKKYQIPIKQKKKKSKDTSFGGIITLLILLFIISRFFRGGSTGIGTRRRGSAMWGIPFFFGGFGGGSGGGFSGGGFSGGGFGGGFGGLSGGGGASGSW